MRVAYFQPWRASNTNHLIKRVEKSAHLEWRLIPLPGYANEIKAMEIQKRLAQKMQGTESRALVRLLVFLILGPTIRDCHFSHNVAVRRERIEEETSPASQEREPAPFSTPV